MKHFTIDNDTNNITVYGSPKEADAIPNSERFSNEGALAKLATTWPVTRLAEIWNSLPGETPVKKFKDRATGVGRIWNAIQNLAVTESEAPSEGNELIAEVLIATGAEGDTAAEEIIEALAATSMDATATNIAPQDAHVAPESPASGNTASQPESTLAEPAIDKGECDRLLRISAETQTAYWNALREFEQAIGFEIDDPGDLREATLEELVERRKPVRKLRAQRTPGDGTKAPRENSKTSQVISMLKRPEGATLEEIMTAMKWLKHTTRAMLSAGGSLVKNHGLVITTEMVGETKRYYIKG